MTRADRREHYNYLVALLDERLDEYSEGGSPDEPYFNREVALDEIGRLRDRIEEFDLDELYDDDDDED